MKAAPGEKKGRKEMTAGVDKVQLHLPRAREMTEETKPVETNWRKRLPVPDVTPIPILKCYYY